MLLFIKCIISFLFGLILSLLTGFILLPILRRHNLRQHLSIYLERKHDSKKYVPTFGGLIFIIPTIIILCLFIITNKIEMTYNLFICLFTFLGYSLIGLIDDYLIVIKQNNQGLSETSKLILQVILAIIIFYLFLSSGNEPLLWIHSIGLKINIGWLYGVFILLVLLSSSNAVNITDGLDGLAGGLSLISLLTLGIITINTGWMLGFESVAIFIFVLSGCILGFLFFNVNPAKIFMGDTGSLALGATLGIVAILTRHELLLVLIGFVFVIETLTCVIQRIYYKMTRKRIFPMTPIHHTFEMYLPENEVVKIFWIMGLFMSLISLIYGVWL